MKKHPDMNERQAEEIQSLWYRYEHTQKNMILAPANTEETALVIVQCKLNDSLKSSGNIASTVHVMNIHTKAAAAWGEGRDI